MLFWAEYARFRELTGGFGGVVERFGREERDVSCRAVVDETHAEISMQGGDLKGESGDSGSD